MSQPEKQRRRDKRYRTRLPIRTRISGRPHTLFTEDVSFRGLFLVTEKAPPVRQLIRIETALPPENLPFATHGMVVYVIGPGEPDGRVAGVGVQFYGMGDERRVWEAFIHFIQGRSEQAPDRRGPGMEAPALAGWPPGAAAADQTEDPIPVRVAVGSGAHDNRRFHRFPLVLEVRPRDVDELLRMYTRDISVGGMFLATGRDIPVGSELRLDVCHPHADAVFPLTAVVRRRTEGLLGVGVEFTGLDENHRRLFFDFIHAPIPSMDYEDIELLESD